MEFFSSSSGPQRDHAVVADATVVAKLDALADKMMEYRSAEQKLTDHHQRTGFASAGPLAFGQFEVGRSSMPQNQQFGGTFQFKATTQRGIIYPHMDGHNKLASGDPGAYDPNEGRADVAPQPEIQQYVAFTHNKSGTAFNAKSARELGDVAGLVPGKGVPGPGQYQASKAKATTYRAINPCRNDFKSNSLQRPKSDSTTPGPGTYRVKHESVEAHWRDSGAAMRSTRVRMNEDEKSMTGPDIGPGQYEEHLHKSIASNLKYLQRAQSAHKPGFGTKSPQRQLPYGQKGSAPDPGYYQPTIWSGRKVGTKVVRQQ